VIEKLVDELLAELVEVQTRVIDVVIALVAAVRDMVADKVIAVARWSPRRRVRSSPRSPR